MAEIFSIFFTLIIICVILSVVFILYKAIRIFTYKGNSSTQSNKSHKKYSSSKNQGGNKHKKVFSEDEGEYVPFEEIKDDK